eukprot:PhF_6_TR26343/c1_g1_i1/m.37901
MGVPKASELYHSLTPYFEGILFVLSHLPKQRTVAFRGLRSQPSFSKEDGLTLQSFTSTSLKQEVADKFAGASSDSSMNVLQVCSGVYIRFASRRGGEEEIMIAP